jgi:glycosyltransferase involved in cell wall biosynthesis
VGLRPVRTTCSRTWSRDNIDGPVLGERPKVTLTIIARNEQINLPNCLESVRGLFDEIIVIDTGSHDRTAEIARSFGANVFDFPWIDDFAAARNEALARATGDYAFWLDADDVVDPPERVKLRMMLNRLRRGDEAGYVVRCACDPAPDGSGGETVVDHIRLLALRPGVRWVYRVHEQILPSMRQAKIPVGWIYLTVRHTGYADKELRAKKLDRDIARTHQMMSNSQEAIFACIEGLELDPQDAELRFRKGVVHRHRIDDPLPLRSMKQCDDP